MGQFRLDKNTMDRFLEKCREIYGERPFIAYEGEEYLSYEQFSVLVKNYRKLYWQRGLKKGDALAFLASGSPRWAAMWMAAMTSGIVAVPIMEDFSSTDVEHILIHSGARALCLEQRYVDWELNAFGDMEFIYLIDEDRFIKEQPLSLIKYSDIGESLEIREEDPAEYMYTSGTTGFSKGVILTHGNLVSNLYEGTDLIDDCFDQDSLVISLLPVGHTFGSTSAFLSTMYKGPRIAFLKRKPTVPYLKDVFARNKPTILGAVPLIFEKIYQKQVLPIKNKSAFLSFILDRVTPVRKIFHRIAAKKVLNFLGGKIRCIIIGGAPFSPDVERFMEEGGIPYVLGYGLTETSPLLTFCSLNEVKTGSVGHKIHHTEIRIVNEKDGVGDIEVKGPQVMAGYLNDPEATAEVFTEDGWFITGDKGYLDDEGYLFLLGRSKNVIITPSGENIYPEAIEALLIGSPLVEEAMVSMDEGVLTAHVYPDYALAESTPGSDALGEKLEELRQEINKKMPASSYLYKMAEQTEPFIKTPSKKIKRNLYL